jgi:glycosyltransferase involved in cell wall biosynthesis
MDELIINGRFLCQQATGVQRVSREFVMALDRLLGKGEYTGLKVHLVAPSPAEFSSLQLEHIETRHLRGGTGYWWEQVALPWHAGRRRLACLGNAAPILGLLGRGRVGVMLHDQSYRFFPDDYGRGYRLAHGVMDHFIVRRARPLLTVSNSEADQIRRNNRGRPETIVVAPNGSWINDRRTPPPVSTFDKTSGAGVQGVYVLNVGGFSDRKNGAGIFAAARALAQQGIAIKLVGRSSERSEAFRAALEPQLQPFITLTDFVDDEVLAELYRNAACLIYPSLYEASGLPPSEAMHFGCPVVVSDLPVLRERCGSAALYCSPNDHATIVDRVMEILSNPALAADLSVRGTAWSEQLTWENQARIIMDAMMND